MAQAPRWMISLNVFLGLTALVALAFFMYSYMEHSRLAEIRLARQDTLEQLKLQRDTWPDRYARLSEDILFAQASIEAVNNTSTDAEAGIKNLQENNVQLLASLDASARQRVQHFRELIKEAKLIRADLGAEEKRELEANAEYEANAEKQRERVKALKQDNERARKQARERELELERENKLLANRIRELTNQREIARAQLRSDGRISAARADLGFVIIDIGHEENLRPGTEFEVYTVRGGKNVRKGRIRVLEVGTRSSEARILSEYDLNDPIIQGDHLHNPIFHPNETKVFVIKGEFDRFSIPELSRFIRDAGGQVDDQLSIKAHYLVAGDQSEEALELAKKYGITILSEQHLLEFIRGEVVE